jgi:hypothetical protein
MMAVVCAQGERVQLTELVDLGEGGWRESGFAFEGVEDDTFQKVPEGHVFELGKSFENFEEAFFEADAGLDAIDLEDG